MNANKGVKAGPKKGLRHHLNLEQTTSVTYRDAAFGEEYVKKALGDKNCIHWSHGIRYILSNPMSSMVLGGGNGRRAVV